MIHQSETLEHLESAVHLLGMAVYTFVGDSSTPADHATGGSGTDTSSRTPGGTSSSTAGVSDSSAGAGVEGADPTSLSDPVLHTVTELLKRHTEAMAAQTRAVAMHHFLSLLEKAVKWLMMDSIVGWRS